jgi:hypothetical protein
VGASSGKIQVSVAVVPIVRTEISHLEYVMCKASENRTPGDVACIFPAFGSVADLEFDMFFNVFQSRLP